MSELAEVCLDGELSQTCPPDFQKWLQLKLWILDDKTISGVLVMGHPAADYAWLFPISGGRWIPAESGPV